MVQGVVHQASCFETRIERLDNNSEYYIDDVDVDMDDTFEYFIDNADVDDRKTTLITLIILKWMKETKALSITL